MKSSEFEVPDEDELADFFGNLAVEQDRADGYWCYEALASEGTTLRFSMDLNERSVQTEVRVGTIVVATISHEMATRLSLDGNVLRCEFACVDCRTALTIDRSKGYELSWSTLRTR